MSTLKEFLSHSTFYFIGQTVVTVGGLVSMPILTRLLTKEDYGELNVFFLSVTILSVVASLGLPQATTRFYSEYYSKGDRRHLRQFFSNMAMTSVACGVVVAVALTILFQFASKSDDTFLGIRGSTFRYIILLFLTRLVINLVLQAFRSAKSVSLYNVVIIANRYLGLSLSIFLILLMRNGVEGVLIATVAVEMAVALGGVIHLVKGGKLGLVAVSKPILLKAIKFGLPVILADLSSTLVASGDRYAIQFFLGTSAVASYAVVYDLSENIAAVLLTPIRLAIIPIVLLLWESGESARVSQLMSQVVNYSVALIIPLIFGFCLVGQKLIVVLASSKYEDSGVLVPYIISGVMLGAIQFLFFTGLIIEKRTGVICLLQLFGAIFNLALNFLLIPYLGLMGSAQATLITFALLLLVTHQLSSKSLPICLDWMLQAKSLVVSTFMIVFLRWIGTVSRWQIVDLLFQSLLGASFYVICLIVFDKGARSQAHSLLRRWASHNQLSYGNSDRS